MAILTGNLTALYDPSFRFIFKDQLGKRNWDPIYPKLFNMGTSDRKFEKASILTNLGYLVEKASGAAFTYEDLKGGFDRTQTHKTYALGVEISQESLEDDLHDLLKQAPRVLGQSVKHSMERDAAAIFNNAFAAGTTYGDGQPLLDTDHPRLDGSDMANKPSSNTDLTATALIAGIQNLRESLDHKGLPQFLKPKYLLVAPAFEQIATELVESKLRPGTANNDMNYIGKYGLQVIVNPYLQSGAGGDDDAWFILCEVHGLRGWIRKAPSTQTVVAESTGNMLFRVRGRWLFDVDHPFGIYGSPGA